MMWCLHCLSVLAFVFVINFHRPFFSFERSCWSRRTQDVHNSDNWMHSFPQLLLCLSTLVSSFVVAESSSPCLCSTFDVTEWQSVMQRCDSFVRARHLPMFTSHVPSALLLRVRVCSVSLVHVLSWLCPVVRDCDCPSQIDEIPQYQSVVHLYPVHSLRKIQKWNKMNMEITHCPIWRGKLIRVITVFFTRREFWNFQQSNQCPKLVCAIKTDAATSRCQACVVELALHIARGSSKKDSARARATEQAMMEAQRIRHACSARLRINHTSWRDFALASKLMNCRASSDHRPDASIPKTTCRALARGPTSSGHLLSFRRLAAVKATPSTSAAPLLAVPSPRRVLTMVASIASCAPPNNGNPSTATSSLRASTCPGPGPSKSRSLTKTFVVTRPPTSRQMRAVALSRANGDDQRRRRSGHTGNCAQWEVKASGGGASRARGRLGHQTWWDGTSGMWTMLGNTPEPWMPRSSWETDPSRGKIDGLWTRPCVATLSAHNQARNLQALDQELWSMVPINSLLDVAASWRVGDVGNPSNCRTNSVATSLASNLTNWPRMLQPFLGKNCATPDCPRTSATWPLLARLIRTEKDRCETTHHPQLEICRNWCTLQADWTSETIGMRSNNTCCLRATLCKWLSLHQNWMSQGRLQCLQALFFFGRDLNLTTPLRWSGLSPARSVQLCRDWWPCRCCPNTRRDFHPAGAASALLPKSEDDIRFFVSGKAQNIFVEHLCVGALLSHHQERRDE